MSSDSLLTEQKKEFYLDEIQSRFIKYSWLWQLGNFRENVKKLVTGNNYSKPSTLSINHDGLMECWNLEFYPVGYDCSFNDELCFFIWRDEYYARTDLKPIIKISILDNEMKKVNTVSCTELLFFRSNNYVAPDEYVTSLISLQTVLDPTGNILSNDKLSILIEFELSVKYTTKSTQVQSYDKLDAEGEGEFGTLSDDLSKYLDNDDLTDFVLEVNGIEFKVHKFLLAARSPVFARMFKQKEMTETVGNRVKIDDMETNVVKQILEFIYTDKAPSKIEEFSKKLLIAARKYQLDRLSSMCEEVLARKISLDNALDILMFADNFELEKLSKAVVEFVRMHRSLLEKEEFSVLERFYPSLAIKIYRAITAVK